VWHYENNLPDRNKPSSTHSPADIVFFVEHDKNSHAGKNDHHFSTDYEFISVADYDDHNALHHLLINNPLSLHQNPNPQPTNIMLYTIATVLLVLWVLGFVSAYTMGGFIHILLVFALVVLLLQIIQGRKIG